MAAACYALLESVQPSTVWRCRSRGARCARVLWVLCCILIRCCYATCWSPVQRSTVCCSTARAKREAAVRTLLRGKAPKSCGLESGPRALEHSVRAFRLHTHELRSVAQQGLHLAMQCNAMQCNAMPCHAMPCKAIQCNPMQCSHGAATLSAFLLPKQSGEGAWEYCHEALEYAL
jgi:hypothetical protein